MRKVFGWLAVAVIVLASALASGSPPAGNVKQRVVNYSDLNLSNRADAVTLYKRISRAARGVCRLPLHLDESGARAQACYVIVLERSVRQVNAPELTRWYESRHRSRHRRMLAPAMGRSEAPE